MSYIASKRTLQDSLNDNFYFETFSFMQTKSLKAYPAATILVRFLTEFFRLISQ